MQMLTRFLSFFNDRKRARRGGALLAIAALASLPFGSGCAAPGDDNSSSYLIVSSLNAASGAEPTKLGGVLHSDVITCATSTGAADPACPVGKTSTVFDDPGQVKFQLGMKNSSLTPTSANFITVNRYHVDFARTDGGTGVPASFDSAFTVTVTSTDAQGGFTLVPAAAKFASPLVQLRSGGDIFAVATVTFFGKDQNGRDVQATATIGIFFSNWGDPG